MRKYLLHVLVIALVSICLGGCTSSPYSKVIKPNKILPAYVDPLPYEQYDCSQIGTEMERVTSELDQLYLDVEKRRKIDEEAVPPLRSLVDEVVSTLRCLRCEKN
jgi:hypothetical protein